MGQTMTSETLCISGSDGYYYCVGLQVKPICRGYKKTVYKGVLLGCGPRQWEKVIAKSFTDIPGTKEYWSDEVNKASITKQLAIKFAENLSGRSKIKVLIPGLVQMDEVSKVNKWLEHRHGHRALNKEEWISIEEYIPGYFYLFCPWSEGRKSENMDIKESDHLQTFAHFTYKETNCELVVCDFQGIFEKNTYIITDSIIHSKFYNHGRFDEGEYGITEFFKYHKCSNICKDWEKPLPSTPLSPSDDVLGNSKQVRFDLAPNESYVFPSEIQNVANESPHKKRNRRHSRERDTKQRGRSPERHLKTQNGEELHRQIHRFRSSSQSSLPADTIRKDLHSRSRAISDGGQHLTMFVNSIDSHSISDHELVENACVLQRQSCLKNSFRNKKKLIMTNEFPLSPKIGSFDSSDKILNCKEQFVASCDSYKTRKNVYLLT